MSDKDSALGKEKNITTEVKETKKGTPEYIIAPRISKRAIVAGVQPMGALQMQSAVRSMEGMGLEVVEVIKPSSGLASFAAGSGLASEIFVVRMEDEIAPIVQSSAPVNMIVERNARLSYGVFENTPIPPQVGLLRGVSPQRIKMRIVGTGDKPVSNAHVTVQGIGFPTEGTTDANGEVTLDVFNRPQARPRYVFVQPGKNFWTRYINSPDLSPDQLNIIRVQSLGETIPDFPARFQFGWGQELMGLNRFPDELTGRGVKIAVIDSGADNTHPLLQHIRQGEDYTDENAPGSWANDIVTHGSHCAGVIAAKITTTIQWRGFAPEAEIHVLKVFPGGRFDSLLKALDYCITNEIDVVNMSLGSAEKSETVEQKLEEAFDNGVVCIVAAGNSGGPVQYPASSPYAVAVSALGKVGVFSQDSWDSQTVTQGLVAASGLFSPSFTCFGPEIDVCAPGVAVISTVPGSSFEPQSGTSMAAPHITGLAALLLAHHPLFKSDPLNRRNGQRVRVAVDLMKSSCAPMNFGPGRTGAGMPTLDPLIQAMRATTNRPTAASPTATPSEPGGESFSQPQATVQDALNNQLGALRGGLGGVALGQGQLGTQFGNAGNFFPFQAGPQLIPQSLLTLLEHMKQLGGVAGLTQLTPQSFTPLDPYTKLSILRSLGIII